MRRRIFLGLSLLLLFTVPGYATIASTYSTYATGGEVTAANLNGNFNNIRNVVNGGLDNDNADVSGGYRFVETKSSLPSAGTQGRVVYNTSDDTLNLDSGSAWSTFSPFEQGMIILWSGSIATIPTGWELADGSCSITCPDLRDKFVVGAKQDDSGTPKTNVTGSLTQSGGSATHNHTNGTPSATIIRQSGTGGIVPSDTHTHTISTESNLPPYYALAYIIKD